MIVILQQRVSSSKREWTATKLPWDKKPMTSPSDHEFPSLQRNWSNSKEKSW